jgi:hypothetical protein
LPYIFLWSVYISRYLFTYVVTHERFNCPTLAHTVLTGATSKKWTQTLYSLFLVSIPEERNSRNILKLFQSHQQHGYIIWFKSYECYKELQPTAIPFCKHMINHVGNKTIDLQNTTGTQTTQDALSHGSSATDSYFQGFVSIHLSNSNSIDCRIEYMFEYERLYCWFIKVGSLSLSDCSRYSVVTSYIQATCSFIIPTTREIQEPDLYFT